MKKPYVICHMLTSLDGKIDGAFFGAPESEAAFLKTNAPVAFALGEVKKLDGNALWLRYMAKGHTV